MVRCSGFDFWRNAFHPLAKCSNLGGSGTKAQFCYWVLIELSAYLLRFPYIKSFPLNDLWNSTCLSGENTSDVFLSIPKQTFSKGCQPLSDTYINKRIFAIRIFISTPKCVSELLEKRGNLVNVLLPMDKNGCISLTTAFLFSKRNVLLYLWPLGDTLAGVTPFYFYPNFAK